MIEGRNDLHLTSTGRGNEQRERSVFPPVSFKRSVLNQLPSSLANDGDVRDFYITTTGAAHDYKPAITSEKNMHKKAPGHWGVKYVEDTIKKLHVKPQRTPLKIAFQSSEMKDQFQGKEVDNSKRKTKFSAHVQPPVFCHHHTNGPLKSLVASSDNPELSGQKYNIRDRGVFNYHGDMYLTTTQKDHRSFSKEEKNRYPRKDYATYWECEKYSKAWGHGSKHNPLPVDSVPREKGPMRDHIWFKTSTVIPRIPKQLHRVPHKGMCSNVIANFKTVSAAERDKLFHCPVDTPWELHAPNSEEMFNVPKMYETEYQSYASGRSVIV